MLLHVLIVLYNCEKINNNWKTTITKPRATTKRKQNRRKITILCMKNKKRNIDWEKNKLKI